MPPKPSTKLSILPDSLKEAGACQLGKRLYKLAKAVTWAANATKSTHRLRADVISTLGPMYQEIALTQVRFKVGCNLPSNWYAERAKFHAITFGTTIYFKDKNIQKTESGLALLMHELVHVLQVHRFGGEEAFACQYGIGYAQGGSYENNPLEVEATNFVASHPVPPSLYQGYVIMEWWGDFDFKGKHHSKQLFAVDHGKNIKLKHNDAMKSLKLLDAPGWKVEIYDSPQCSKNDDWGEVIYPHDHSINEVNLPRVGHNGVTAVRPEGCYRFHYKNGLAGKVSAIKHYEL